MSHMKHFAKTVADRRHDLHLTQEELANKLNITAQAVSKWENGVGLPDVTLFPSLAAALELPIASLFGEPTSQGIAFPETYCGLPRQSSFGEFACYAKETPVESAEGLLRFADGSTADLKNAEVVNFGKGEIRIRRGERPAIGELISEVKRHFSDFSSVSATISGNCKLELHSATGEEPTLFAVGSHDFLSRLDVKIEGQTLRLQAKNNNGNNDGGAENRITLALPFAHGQALGIHVGGCCDVKCTDVDFDHGECQVSGCGNLKLQNFETLSLGVSGCGDISFGKAKKKLEVRVSGSGEVKGAYAANPNVSISGAGDVKLSELEGEMEVHISGSGELTCAGHLSQLIMDAAGNGTLHGEGLTVAVAHFTVDGGGDLTLGAITDHSVERLGQNCSLLVGKRG